MKKYTIAYITETSPFDKHAWSGTVHYIYKALEKQGHTLIPLGPAKPVVTDFFCKVINQLCLKILNKRFDYRHSIIYSKAFGKLFSKKLKQIDCDIVLVVGGTEYAAYLKTTKPIYIVVDRTIEGALNYHSILSNLLSFSQKQSIETDKKAMTEARKVFFSSEWAEKHAEKHYHLPKQQRVFLPFGANLDVVPNKDIVFSFKNEIKCNLLLIGTHWKNKGVDIAIEALKQLRAKSIEAHLTIVGCQPENIIDLTHITHIPFINKNTKDGLAQMEKLFFENDFFILPTRFEAYGIVFCEASAYGLISFATNTGGVPSVVKQGVNGFVISDTDDGTEFANKIYEVYSNPDEVERLRVSARNFYEEKLNWESWAIEFTKEVDASF